MEVDFKLKDEIRREMSFIGMDMNEYIDLRKDFMYLRDTRKRSESMVTRIQHSIIASAAPGVLYVIWLAFKHTLS